MTDDDIFKIIEEELDYHQFKWWNKILSDYPETIVYQFLTEQKDLNKVITIIQKEDKKILRELDKLIHQALMEIEEQKAAEELQRAAEELQSLAWSALIGNSGVFRYEIKSLKTKMSYPKKRESLNEFIDVLKSCEAGELAMALVVASNFSQSFKGDTGLDLYLPFACVETDTKIFDFLLKACSESSIGKANTIIWVHTILAASDIKLRGLGRDMWQEISRGFSEVEHHEKLMSDAINYKFNIDYNYKFPAGFSPIKTQSSGSQNLENTEDKLKELLELYEKGLITKDTLTEMQINFLKEKF